jgi:hypothetical protein
MSFRLVIKAMLSRRLIFGRFIRFMPVGINLITLTERAFRKHLEQTDSSLTETQRFHEIARGAPLLDEPEGAAGDGKN